MTATAPSSHPRSRPRQIGPARYVAASCAVGVAFVLLDAILNANPIAQGAYAAFAPLARSELVLLPAVTIDVVYGFVLCAVFVGVQGGLPGRTPLSKGVSFGLLVWFFRVIMGAAAQWVMFDIPAVTVAYSVGAGLVEMLVIGVLVGLLTLPEVRAGGD